MAIKAKTLITLTQERQITEIRNFYKATSTNIPPSAIASSIISNWTSAGWETSEPAYNSSTPYVWICRQTIFGIYNVTTNPNNYINSEVSLSSSYTAAIEAQILANSIAANTASFWTRYTDGYDKNNPSIPILAGSYMSSNPNVDYLDTSTFDYNSHLNSNALTFRYKNLNLAKYATNGVHFYKIATGITYKLSTDENVDISKTYYIYNDNVFTKVDSPSGNPSEKNYYEAVATFSQNDPVIELTYDIIDIDGTPNIKNRLTFYDPETSNRTMELQDSELAFYLPNNGVTKAISLTSNGLKLIKGGIEGGDSGTNIGNNGYIYLSTEDKSNITINGYTPGPNDPKWRAIIGSNFGVDSAGKLYAKNANIDGVVTVSGGSIAGNVTIGGSTEGSATVSLSTVNEITNYVKIENGGITLGNPNGFHIYIDGDSSQVEPSRPDAITKTFGLGFYQENHSREYVQVDTTREIVDKNTIYYILNSNGQYEKVTGLVDGSTFPTLSEGYYYKEKDKRIAYINQSRLSIPYTVVLKGMELGEEWIWELNSKTKNLTLKWQGEE